MKENFNYEDESKDVIAPILYNNHVSILLVHSNGKNGFVPSHNYLLDIRGVNYNFIYKDSVFIGVSLRHNEKFQSSIWKIMLFMILCFSSSSN